MPVHPVYAGIEFIAFFYLILCLRSQMPCGASVRIVWRRELGCQCSLARQQERALYR